MSDSSFSITIAVDAQCAVDDIKLWPAWTLRMRWRTRSRVAPLPPMYAPGPPSPQSPPPHHDVEQDALRDYRPSPMTVDCNFSFHPILGTISSRAPAADVHQASSSPTSPPTCTWRRTNEGESLQ
ncbi:unnamed protein product [Prorocentrum cordatum]|uniref:Uncharacterized protein n=1 Tax=Prorocentrum cordatum TaxID=2364126 RepID=A0ABN9PXS4_9DINO|nr:unnamed protein product [Polarella glacialis]